MPQKVLKRKTSRRYKSRKSIEKDFDLYKFKDQMSKEMSRFKNKIANPSSQPIVSDYDKKYKQYITEGFTMSTLMIVNRMFSDSKSLPRDLRNNYPLHSLLIKIIRQLMMNELELVYFSIYLDIFGWKNNNFDIMDHFLITGLSVKKYLNINTEYLETYLNNEYPDILDKFNKWLKAEKDYNLLITISPRDVNERFNLLKRPFNTYCKNNFIDYNESVDRILHMSLPYNENVKHGTNEKTFHPLDEFEPKPKNIKIQISKKDKDKGKEETKKKYVSFKVEKNAMLPPPVPINKSYSNLNLAARNSNLNFNKSINHGGINTSTLLFPQTSNPNLNLALGQQSTLSNVNVNYNQILNFTNTTSVGNFNNTNSNFVNGNDLMKQQSEINFNEGAMLLGRTASGFDHSLMPRTSQPFLDGNDDALQECFFRPMELKHNLSLTSLAGDFKGEPSIFNLGLNKMYSNTPSTFKPMMSNTNVSNVNRNNIKEDDTTNNNNINNNTIGNMTLNSNSVNNGKDNYNLFKSLNTTAPSENTINNLGQTSYSLRQGTQNAQGTKKNLLMMYQKMANEKK